MIRFEDIQETVQRHHPDTDLEILRKAYIFSAVEHKGQVRASGEPYLVHPLEVAAILAEMRMDPICVAVGLLHDVLEDTLTTPERLLEYFGPDVLHIVEGVTKISKIPFATTEERQAETYRKMLLAMVDDIRVILVKLADRLHNMRTLQHLPEDRQQRISRETLDIYAPIAGRLGMAKVKNELEDLAFRYLDPAAYEALAARVAERRERAAAFVEKIRTTVAEKLRSAGVEARIEGRIKRLHSIQQKLKRQKIDLEQVYDFVALRVLVDGVPDCYAALGRPAQHLAPGARGGSRTSSPCPARTATSPCTPPSSRRTATPSRCRSAPTRCTASPRRASPPTGSTRRAAPGSTRTTTRSPGCGSCSSGSRRSRTPTSS